MNSPSWLDRFEIHRKAADVWEGASPWRWLAGAVYALFQIELGTGGGDQDPFYYQVYLVPREGQWLPVYRASSMEDATEFRSRAEGAARSRTLQEFMELVGRGDI